METTTPAGQPIVDREKTAPFLIRAFIRPGGFHRLAHFQDGPLPTADEQQIFTWRDATLAEVLTTLRSTAPHTPEYRHPLARYSFRAVYADSANRGQFAQKDLGVVYSRDILGEPGTLENTAARLLEDAEGNLGPKDARTLDELRFVPGDYLCVAVMLPKNVTLTPAVSGELTIKGSGSAGAANGWKQSPVPLGRGGPPVPLGRGGGHWRGGSDVPPVSAGRGRGGRADFGRDRDLDRMRDDRDRRPPPPRRGETPPPRGGWGDRDRDRGRPYRDARSRSRSRSRTPPRRRR